MTEGKQKIKICQDKVVKGNDEFVTLIACGDIGLYGALGKRLEIEGASSILGDAKAAFEEADLVFGNLEGPVSDRGSRHKLPPPYPALRMNPNALGFLKESGFDILSLSNNHMLDYGPEALLDTINRLNEAGIVCFGAGKDEADAWEPKVLAIKGIEIGFIGFHEGGAPAKKNSPGAALFGRNRGIKHIKNLKSKVDIVVVSYHFGFDYFTCPSPYHVKICRGFVERGADLVLGHHPHVPQGVESYKNGLILYSLGNFAFWLGDAAPSNSKQGFMAKIELTRTGICKLDMIPYRMNSDLSISLREGIEREKELFEHKDMSEALQDSGRFRHEWYINLRNFYLGYIVYYMKFDLLKGNPISFIGRIMRLFNPTQSNRIKLKSLIYFVFTGYFIKIEAKRLVTRLSSHTIHK